ncbi:hypothetical protein BSU04_16460 [Caballeronia sordidicola]|uniref:Transcriptional regulator, MarR family n=2 Tax=Caballeronia sordidicola TaxID=196367 RepID=A0A226X3D7_CABSO|nr:hypothetical protein BSU04_16460 [Caballeronia sordidicola]
MLKSLFPIASAFQDIMLDALNEKERAVLDKIFDKLIEHRHSWPL